MEYENFDKARILVNNIEAHLKIMDQLDNESIGNLLSLKIIQGSYSVMTIGCWKDCEDSCSELANVFIKSVKKHYQDEVIKLRQELSKL